MKKILLVAGIAAALYYFSKQKNKPEETKPNTIDLSIYEGKAIRTDSDPGWYKVRKGEKIVYTHPDAYVLDNSPELITVSLEVFNSIPLVNDAWYTPQGLIDNRTKELIGIPKFDAQDFKGKL